MNNGRNKESLFRELETQENLLACDQVYNPGERVNIIASVRNGRLMDPVLTKTGKKFQSVEDAVNAVLSSNLDIKVQGAYNAPTDVWTLSANGKDYSSQETGGLIKMIESILKDGADKGQDSLEFSITKSISPDFRWTIEENGVAYKAPKTIERGKGSELLLSTLRSLDKTVSSEMLTVLCLAHAPLHREWNGRIKTTWIRVDPEYPFCMDESGKPMFETMNFELDEVEYSACIETKIAFYSENTNTIYPIRAAACDSVGKLFDCSGVFKPEAMDDIPLGIALILANKIINTRTIQFLYRDRTALVKPLVSVAGSRFQRYSQVKFFDEALSLCREYGICSLDKWTITDERTSVEVSLDMPTSAYRVIIELIASDLPGSSMSASAYAVFGKTRVLLRKSSSYHTTNLSNEGAKCLFDSQNTANSSIFDAIDAFRMAYDQLNQRLISFDPSVMKPLYSIIGRKKGDAVSAEISKIDTAVEYSADVLFSKIASSGYDGRYGVLSDVQKNAASLFYANLFNEFAGEEILQPKLKKITRNGGKTNAQN